MSASDVNIPTSLYIWCECSKNHPTSGANVPNSPYVWCEHCRAAGPGSTDRVAEDQRGDAGVSAGHGVGAPQGKPQSRVWLRHSSTVHCPGGRHRGPQLPIKPGKSGPVCSE